MIEDATPQNPNGSCEVVARDAPNRADSRDEDRRRTSPAEDNGGSGPLLRRPRGAFKRATRG